MAIDDRFTPQIDSTNAPPPRYLTLTTDGSVTIADGTVFLNSTASISASLDAPPTAMDGARLTFINVGGAAHKLINVDAAGFNSGGTASDTATFTTSNDVGLSLHAFNGVWYRLETQTAIAAT